MKTLQLVIMLAVLIIPDTWVLAEDSQDSKTLDKFRVFLEHSLQKKSIGREDVKTFYEKTFPFWREHLQDYLHNPDRYQSLLSLYYKNQALYRPALMVADIDQYKAEIERFKNLDARNTAPSKAVLFVGSSSIVLWETAVAFPYYPVINRGFGGSTLIDVNHFYDEVVKKYAPAIIVLYCDNDIYLGAVPAMVLKRFQDFSDRVGRDLPNAKLIFLSIKPTPTDDFCGKDVRENGVIANGLIKEFVASRKNMRFVDVATPMFRDGKLRLDIFLPDGMHLNARGYSIWNPIVAENLANIYPAITDPDHRPSVESSN